MPISSIWKEMELLAPHLGGRHQLAQLHFGGGTPTFLSDDQLERVFEMIRKYAPAHPQRRILHRNRPAQSQPQNRPQTGQTRFQPHECRHSRLLIPKCRQPSTVSKVTKKPKKSSMPPAKQGFKSVSVDLILRPAAPKHRKHQNHHRHGLVA